MKIFFLLLFLLGSFPFSSAQAAEKTGLLWKGVNLSGGEFGKHRRLPGKYGRDYLYPSVEDVALYATFGMNVVRIPFLWERLQRQLNMPFDEEELERLEEVVEAASDENMMVILDPHSDGKYNGRLIGSTQVPIAAFEDFLTRLAVHFKGNSKVAFGLMDEPFKQPADEWAKIAQAGVLALRKAGVEQLILVPGTLYTSAHRWRKRAGRFSNSEALSGLKDPLNNFAFEVHQYFDFDASGTHSTCESELIGEELLSYFTQWLRVTGNRGFLAEFATSKNPLCLVALKQTLAYMEKNADVWLGWTYWGASAWFEDYMFSIYPPDPERFPQAAVLKEFLTDSEVPEE